MESRFLVTKETYAYRFCKHCSGSGTTSRTFQGQKIKTTCPICYGKGKEKITHRTEVNLMQALIEIQNSQL